MNTENEKLKQLIKEELIFSLENKDEASGDTLAWREKILTEYFPFTMYNKCSR